MMEQPTETDSKEDNKIVEEKKPGTDLDPIRIPELDPKPEVGGVKQENHGDVNNTDRIKIEVDLNGSNSSLEENLSPSAGLKSKKSVRWSEELVMESQLQRDYDRGSNNPYVNYSPTQTDNSSSFNFKDTMGNVKDVLGRWGKKVGEATRKAEDLAGNTWQHLKTSPRLADAALGRIAQGTKVLAEGGYEKIFLQTFETVPEEQLKNSFACYLSTSAGPVMGVLYVSTAKLAFCSDNPLSYQSGEKTEWSYYKVVIPLHQLQAVNSSTSRTNSAEKYIQVISVDNHEFWYMGFLNYGGAVKSLKEAFQARDVQSV